MKTMILAAVSALTLGVGAAYAQGAPGGPDWTPPQYGTGWTANHENSLIGQNRSTVNQNQAQNPSSNNQSQAQNRLAPAPRG